MVECSNTNEYYSCAGELGQRAEFPSPDSPASKAFIADPQQDLNSQLPLLLSPTMDHDEDTEEMKGVILSLDLYILIFV